MSLIDKLREPISDYARTTYAALCRGEATPNQQRAAASGIVLANAHRAEALAQLEVMQAEIDRRDEALSWAEGHDPWLVEKIRERASLHNTQQGEG